MARVISYFSLVFITFFFTYIFDIKENYVLMYMLIIAPIMDYLIFIYSKKSIDFKVGLKDESLEKKQYTECLLEIDNTALIPIINVQYEVEINSKFDTVDYLKEKISLSPRSKTIKSIELKAIHRGRGEINIEKLEIKSLLGLFKAEVSMEEYEQYRIIITPALVEVDGVDKLLDKSTNTEESDETSNNMFMGEPGYDFKEYSEGDPLSKVNWKLSSKKNILMIRKHATDIKRKKVIILDPQIQAGINFEDYGDLIIEAIIGIAKELYTLEFEVTIAFKKEKLWVSFDLINIDGIVTLQNTFSSYNFSEFKVNSNRFIDFHNNDDENSDCLIVTCNKDKDVLAFVMGLEEEGNSVDIISNNKVKILEEEYYLNQDYELERI